MDTEKLAFLQNFYTDVTLYVPAEAPGAPATAAGAVPAAAAPPVAPVPVAPVPAPAAPAPAKAPLPEVRLPSKSFSNPTAGLERLATGANVAGAPPAATAPMGAMPAPAGQPAPPTPFSTLGSNAQGVVLLFRLEPEPFARLHRNVFLNKMLQALQLVMADVVLVNVESDRPVALASLRRELAATHIVAFGKNLLDTTLRNTQIYEPVLFPSLGLSYLASATVDLVEYDVSLKKRLWPGLQAMFIN